MKSATTKKNKRAPRKRQPLSPEQLRERTRRSEQRAYERKIRALFERVGFLRVKSSDQQFTFLDRTGELDDIFVYENIVVIAEYYTGKPDTSHLLKKMPLYNNICSHSADFLRMARQQFPSFAQALKQVYADNNIVVRIVYATKEDPSSELQDACQQVTLMYGAVERYFHALVKTIEKSARNEFLKFLKLEYKDVGDACLTSGQNNTSYKGFLLPEWQSSYPQGYKIVSFYADPERLLERSYVLRRG